VIPKLSDDERIAFVAAARTLLGTPFRHQARGPSKVDCAGLAACALADVGRKIEDLAVYGRNPHRDGLQAMVRANLGPPVADAPRPGDIVLMGWDGSAPRHIAIVTDHPHGLGIIHTCSAFRKVVEHSLDSTAAQSGETWRDRIVEVYRP
jgi:cell wall-associated NlpC family hydrolase